MKKWAFVITASLFGIVSALPASAQQTAGQKRYAAYAACRREANSAVPLSGMISTQASMNHYLALGSCLRQRGYDINVTQGGTVGPPGPGSVAGVATRTTRRAVAAGYYGYDYGSSYPYNYGYTNYGSNPYSNYGYANYGSSYGSTDYGSSYPYNYGYSDTHRFPMSSLELWCFPPICDRSRFDEKNAPQAAVPWAGQSLVQGSATPLRPRRFVGNAAQREQASEPGYFGPNAQPWITK
jgi:hypothetical protein